MGDLQDALNGQSVSQDSDGNTHYCPGCGKRAPRAKECHGRGEAPHQEIEMVPIAEILNAPDPEDRAAHEQWRERHTAAPTTA